MALTDHDLADQAAHPEDSSPRSRWVGARMTLDEFMALPEEETSLEFDDGLVTQKMAPFSDHGSLQFQLAKHLDIVGEMRELGMVFTETRFVTPTWAPVPDVSYYRAERIHPKSQDEIGDFHIPPDIAIEIMSPSQSVGEMLAKCLRYSQLGVSISLVVDRFEKTVYDIRPGEPLRVLRGDDQIDLEPVLADFDLTVQSLFSLVMKSWLRKKSREDSPASE